MKGFFGGDVNLLGGILGVIFGELVEEIKVCVEEVKKIVIDFFGFVCKKKVVLVEVIVVFDVVVFVVINGKWKVDDEFDNGEDVKKVRIEEVEVKV